MKPRGKKPFVELGRLRAWIDLTPRERMFAGLLVAILLIGLTARYLHLRGQAADPYRPAGIEKVEAAGGS